MAQSRNGTVTHLADKNHMLFHAHLLQNSHMKAEQSFHLLGIWHIFSFQLVGIWHTMSFLSVGTQQTLLIVHLVSSSLLSQ